MSVIKALNIEAPLVDAPTVTSSTGNSYTTTTWLDMGQYEQVNYRLLASLGSTNTLTAAVIQATSTGGAGAKAVTGAALTTITNGTVNATIKTAEICVGASALDTNNGFRYIKCTATVGALSNANVLAIEASASDVRTSPQTSSITQAVTVLSNSY